jgi:hypothetical protein
MDDRMVPIDRDAPIRVVGFDPSHLPIVRQFAERYWSRPTSDEYYTWRYLDALPIGHLFMALQEQECLGMAYGLRRSYLVDQALTDCLEVFDWHVLPGLKGSGAGLRVMRALMKRPERLVAIGGTQDVQSALPKMGWQRIGTARRFELPLSGALLAHAVEERLRVPARWTARPLDVAAKFWFGPRSRNWPADHTVRIAPMLGSEIDELYERNQYGFTQRPLLPVFKWFSQSPLANGVFCYLRFYEGSRIVGWTLSRAYDTPEGREGAILDAYSPEPNPERYTWMVSQAVSALAGFHPRIVRTRASCEAFKAGLLANRFREQAVEVPIHTWPKGVELHGPVHVTLNHSDEPMRPYLATGSPEHPSAETRPVPPDA